jgi:hypothetical protein
MPKRYLLKLHQSSTERQNARTCPTFPAMTRLHAESTLNKILAERKKLKG